MTEKTFVGRLCILLFLFSSNLFSQTGSSLTISEVMFYPLENNGEYIEIYNTSANETFELSSFKIKYYTSTANNLSPFIGTTLLQPGKRAIILQGNYNYNNGIYKNLIPADAIILRTTSSGFGSSGMANTTSRDVSLLNSANQVVDTYTYSTDNAAGISDEKIFLNKDNNASNWKNSTIANGTPGAPNSVTPIIYNFDLSVRFESITPAAPIEKDSIKISVVIKNNGTQIADNFHIDIFNDENMDSVGQAGEIIAGADYSNLAKNDSMIFKKTIYADKPGSILLIAKIIFAKDEQLNNNTAYFPFTILVKPAAAAEIVVNEIMYAPSNDEPEWIELINKSERTLNLKNWKIGDNTTLTTISSTDYFLNPGEYLVVSRDASITDLYQITSKILTRTIPSLNNSGDDVILKSNSNLTVDSVKYLPVWGGKTGGKSLERISANGFSNDAVNWNTSLSQRKATPGRINSVTQKSYDLSIKNFSVAEKYEVVGKSFRTKIIAENLGSKPAANYSVKIFYDENGDGIDQPNELTDETSGANLLTGTTNVFEFTITNFASGQNQFIAKIEFALDEYADNNSSLLKINGVVLNELRGDLIVNEIMYSPSAPEPEWIEIYNTSRKTIDLKGYKIANHADTTKIMNASLQIHPEEYLVIAKDTLLFLKYPKTMKFAINQFPSLNNAKDKVILLDSLDRTIDSLEYKSSWGGNSGKSLERIETNSSSADSTSWKTSINKLGATPGYLNSVTPFNNDLKIYFAAVEPAKPVLNDSVKVNLVVKNIGKQNAGNFTVEVFNDTNFDSVPSVSEIIFQKDFPSLAKNDSVAINTKLFVPVLGEVKLIAKVNYLPDEKLSDNTSYISFIVSEKQAEYNEVVINEIMYAPANEEPEWIELYNKSNRKINLKNWKAGDSSTLVAFCNQDYYLYPGEYLIVSNDETVKNFYPITSKLISKSLPSMSNSGDDVIIKDDQNKIIDSLKYKPTWGGNTGGRSLERISVIHSSFDESNWKTSASKQRATPGRINSVTLKNNDLSIKNFSVAEKYVVVGKSFKAKVIVENLGVKPVVNYSVKIFYDENRDALEQSNELVGEVFGTNLLTGTANTFEFTITNFARGQNLFIAKIEYTEDEYTENNSAMIKINCVVLNETRGDLIVNEIMYSPVSPEPEWIEIYNSSGKTVDLKGYKIANHSDTMKVISAPLPLHHEEYLVIAKDTLIFLKYPGTMKYVINQFPTLNNTRDKVMLLDSLNRIIDSLEYKSSWGGSIGKSLERLDSKISSTDSTNWKTSIAMPGGTPGFVNSSSQKKNDIAVTDFSFSPSNPMAGQKVILKAEIQNIGTHTPLFKIVLNEIKRDGSKILVDDATPLGDISLNPGGRMTIVFKYSVEELLEKRIFEAEIICADDENQTNNKNVLTIYPGYSAQTVLINEIMYNPSNGEPEWIEFYNNSQYDVDIEEWSITDVLTTPAKSKLQSRDYIIPANSFFVVAKDSTIKNYHRTISSKLIISSFANLNNDADGVVIKDSRGVTIDSTFYSAGPSSTNGKSLERKSLSVASIDKNNWAFSKDIELSTPGRANSVTQKKNDLVLKGIFISPQFPIIGDDVKISAKITNAGLATANDFTVKFFLSQDKIITFLSLEKISNLSPNDSVIVNSAKTIMLTENKTILCQIDFGADEDTLNNFLSFDIHAGGKRNSVLISEIMYDPFNGESEWIEIVNASEEPVNLNNWSVSDLIPQPSKSIITTKENYLTPGEFAVIASDTLRYPYYPPKKFFQAKFGALSSVDGVLIYDFRNGVIDSLKYNSAWGGGKGVSLERLSFTSPTNDSLNWISSLSKNGATPGIKNSIINFPKYSAGALVINEIMYETDSSFSEYLEFYNTTEDSIQLGGMEIRIGKNGKTKLSNSFLKLGPKNYFVLASDSSVVKNYSWLKNDSRIKITGGSFSLPNDGTSLAVKDLSGRTLDSVYYSPNWHNKNFLSTKNRSLERINHALASNDKTNWSSSVSSEGGSPGKQNSIFTEKLSGQSKVTISPNPFSPDNDGFEDFTMISLDLTKPIAQVRIKVFDSEGRLVRTIASNRPASSQNSVIFDGLDDNGRALRIGIYILLMEIADENGSTETLKAPIVVARKL